MRYLAKRQLKFTKDIFRIAFIIRSNGNFQPSSISNMNLYVEKNNINIALAGCTAKIYKSGGQSCPLRQKSDNDYQQINLIVKYNIGNLFIIATIMDS